ncbi:hypothetical protein C8Q78DRAFT_1058813 [Trametes maxima]|nr:hypothetical protein C8Q78DRAFT_1058813 [Trametes maxima]
MVDRIYCRSMHVPKRLPSTLRHRSLNAGKKRLLKEKIRAVMPVAAAMHLYTENPVVSTARSRRYGARTK